MCLPHINVKIWYQVPSRSIYNKIGNWGTHLAKKEQELCMVGRSGPWFQKDVILQKSATRKHPDGSLNLILINNFIHCSLLVPWSSDNVFIICRDVAAQHRWRFFGLWEIINNEQWDERFSPKKETQDNEQAEMSAFKTGHFSTLSDLFSSGKHCQTLRKWKVDLDFRAKYASWKLADVYIQVNSGDADLSVYKYRTSYQEHLVMETLLIFIANNDIIKKVWLFSQCV